MKMKEKKVLMVDDEQGIINNTLKELRKINFSVPVLFESEVNAEKAVNFLRQNHQDYGAVLVDGEFKRQKMQGLGAVKEIRMFSNIPIIMISSSKEACSAGVKFGADDFMPKGLMSREEVEVCKQVMEKVLDPDYERRLLRSGSVTKEEVFRN